jgi:hypothetical protein
MIIGKKVKNALRFLAAVILLSLALPVLAGCESAEQKLGKEVEKAYSEIGSMWFSDESILTADELACFNAIKQSKEEAYRDRNIPALQTVKADWVEFKAPIQARIDEIEAEKRRAAEEEARRIEEEAQEHINRIVGEAKAASDMLTLFSFGTMELSIASRNHSIVYSYKYGIDVGNTDSVKSGLELSTDLMCSVFQALVKDLKEAGVSSPSVIVEYKDKSGNMIYSKEFI